MLDKTIINEIYDLHSQGETNRSIGKKIGIHWNTVAFYLKKKGLISNGPIKHSLNRISNSEAICSKCNKTHNISKFLKNRKNTKKEYYFSYCLDCRKSQLYDNLNSDIQKYLKDRYNKLKRRCTENNILFDLSFDDFIFRYKEQKGKCFYTDIELITKVGKGYSEHSLSVDKIIPEKGYTKHNFVLCTHRINSVKRNLTIEEIKIWMPIFYERICTYWKKLELGLTVFQVAEGDF